MNSISKTWIYGIGAGLIVGIFTAIMVAITEPSASFWMLAEEVIAWVVMGWAVIASNSGLKPILHGIIITVFLNLPWYIQFAALPGQWDHLPPLVIMSIIMGAGFGFIKKKIAN